MRVHNLSEHELYRLKSIDPALSLGWREVIDDIFPKLDKYGQKSIYENILKPRGIEFDEDGEPVYKRRETLRSVIIRMSTGNSELIAIAKHMLKIVSLPPKTYKATPLAAEVEAALSRLEDIDFDESQMDYRLRHKIKSAFLYDLAEWIDTVELSIDKGLRQLDASAVKAYFKEVFIKQQLQGRDFRSWDSSDLSFNENKHIPQFILDEGKNRTFYIVEAQNYWFLVGSANMLDENPYSFRRFLHEDASGDFNEYVYLTSMVVDKRRLSKDDYMSHVAKCMTRMYTLDLGVSENIIKFVNETLQLYKKHLKPVLWRPLSQDGSKPEIIIKERLVEYEKQLTVLILSKLPRVIASVMHDETDQDYLFHHLDQLMKQALDNVQDFLMQPLAIYSTSGEIMVAKLVAMRYILGQSHNLLGTPKIEFKDCDKLMTKGLETLENKLVETEQALRKLKMQQSELVQYNELKKTGSFWQKLKMSKHEPDYTITQIKDMQAAIYEQFYIFIVRLAKADKYSIIYIEFELNETINDNYRHYALADGELGISRLPRILRLSEDRAQFNLDVVKETIYSDIFKANQLWHLTA